VKRKQNGFRSDVISSMLQLLSCEQRSQSRCGRFDDALRTITWVNAGLKRGHLPGESGAFAHGLFFRIEQPVQHWNGFRNGVGIVGERRDLRAR